MYIYIYFNGVWKYFIFPNIIKILANSYGRFADCFSHLKQRVIHNFTSFH